MPPDDVVHGTSDECSRVRNKHIPKETLLRTRVSFNLTMEHHACLPASSMLRALSTSRFCRDPFFLLTSLLLSSVRTSRPFPPPGTCLHFYRVEGSAFPTGRRLHRMPPTHAPALSASQPSETPRPSMTYAAPNINYYFLSFFFHPIYFLAPSYLSS